MILRGKLSQSPARNRIITIIIICNAIVGIEYSCAKPIIADIVLIVHNDDYRVNSSECHTFSQKLRVLSNDNTSLIIDELSLDV